MSLWDVFHAVPGAQGVTNYHAYVNMTHHADFADLGNITFTNEFWFYLPNIYAGILNKGGTISGYSAGWSLGFGPQGSPGYYAPVFWCTGKWYDTATGLWWHFTRQDNPGSKPSAYFTGAWHHYSAMWVRADINHLPDIYVHIDGVLFTTIGYPPPMYSGHTLVSDATIDIQVDNGTYSNFFPMKTGWARISNIARYPLTGSYGDTIFTPIPRLTPPTSDGNTLGLWYFNEGSGITAYDQTGNSSKNATIYSGIWDGNVLTLNI